MFKKLYSIIAIVFILILVTSCAKQDIEINIGDTTPVIKTTQTTETYMAKKSVTESSKPSYIEHEQLPTKVTVPSINTKINQERIAVLGFLVFIAFLFITLITQIIYGFYNGTRVPSEDSNQYLKVKNRMDKNTPIWEEYLCNTLKYAFTVSSRFSSLSWTSFSRLVTVRYVMPLHVVATKVDSSKDEKGKMQARLRVKSSGIYDTYLDIKSNTLAYAVEIGEDVNLDLSVICELYFRDIITQQFTTESDHVAVDMNYEVSITKVYNNNVNALDSNETDVWIEDKELAELLKNSNIKNYMDAVTDVMISIMKTGSLPVILRDN